MTPEQIAEFEKRTEAYLDGKLPLLRKQAEYEELMFKIKNFAYSREIIDVKWAEHRAQQQLMQEQRGDGNQKAGKGGPN